MLRILRWLQREHPWQVSKPLGNALLAQDKTLKSHATDGPARVPQTERKPRLEVHVWPEVKSHTSWCLSLNLRPQGPQESAGKASASISFNPEIQAGTSPLMNALVCLAILNRSPCYLNKRRQTLKTGPLYPLYIRITFSIFDALISWDLVTLKELPLPGLTNSER